MSQRQSQQHTVGVGLRQITQRVQEQSIKQELTEEEELEEELKTEATEEPRESFELEDFGDSEVALEGETAQSPFDREWTSQLPLVYQLPRRARPLVLFRIDENFEVHYRGRKHNSSSQLRLLIARAIAEHLKNNQVALSAPGDWRQLPALETDEKLLDLLGEDRPKLDRVIGKIGSEIKAFAILLPNGDVVTPQALINAAKKGKRATRAAALRMALQKPTRLAGENWSEKDWHDFENTQRKKERGQKKAPSGN